MASHPEITLRINAVEPNFEAKKRKAGKRRAEAVLSGGIDTTPTFASGDTGDISANLAASDRMVLLLPDEQPCLAALFALFVDKEPGRRRDYLNALGVSFEQVFVDQVHDIIRLLPGELADEQVSLIVHVNYPRRTANETGIIKDLEAAFQTLYVQPKPIRLAFVQHCIEIMRYDGRVMKDERALLDLFAASLGCDELVAA